MLGYTISIAALLITIWYEKRQDLPSMAEALDQLEEDQGFEFGNHFWISHDNSSALAIDQKRSKLVLLRAYKGWQQINFDDLVDYEKVEKVVTAPTGGFRAFLKAIMSYNKEFNNISVNILINNLDSYNFSLNLITSASEHKLNKTRMLAEDIVTILKLVKINGEKQQKNKTQKIKLIDPGKKTANQNLKTLSLS